MGIVDVDVCAARYDVDPTVATVVVFPGDPEGLSLPQTNREVKERFNCDH